MDFKEHLIEYKSYLVLEKRLSSNTVTAYIHDINLFEEYTSGINITSLKQINNQIIEGFIVTVYEKGLSKSSQARILSGIKSFFIYLYVYDKIEQLPTELIDMPKIKRKLPNVLSEEQVIQLFSAIDLSGPQGHRNRAILETLYSCGLRVSELVDIKISDLFFDEGYIRVIGKGDKQRLVPISKEAQKHIKIYLEERKMADDQKCEHLFIGRRGGKLSRVMIFILIRDLAAKAGIKLTISPHTLRHTFATHLIKGGADIRMVQCMLGHESILTTDIYTHLDTRFIQESIEEYHPLSKIPK